MSNNRYPAISEPIPDADSLYKTVMELKQTVEILTRQNKKTRLDSAVTWRDLTTLKPTPLIFEDQVPD